MHGASGPIDDGFAAAITRTMSGVVKFASSTRRIMPNNGPSKQLRALDCSKCGGGWPPRPMPVRRGAEAKIASWS